MNRLVRQQWTNSVSGRRFGKWMAMADGFRLRVEGLLVALLAVALRGMAEEGARDISLPQAMDLALRGNRDLRLYQTTVAGQRISVDRAKGALRPSLTPEGAVETSGDGDTVRYGFRVADVASWGTAVEAGVNHARQEPDLGSPVHVGTVRIEVRQPLLRDLGPLVTMEPVRVAESAANAARRELELRKADLLVSVADAFENLLRLQRQVQREEQAEARLARHARLTRSREGQGRASRVDGLRAELRAGRAGLNLSEYRERLALAQVAMADLMGMAAGQPLTAVPGPRMAAATPEPDEGLRIALSNRLDYAQILEDLQDRNRGVRVARRRLLPDLDVIGRYERLGTGPTADDAARLKDDVWFVGLAADTEFPPRDARLDLQRAELAVEATTLRLESIRVALHRQVQEGIVTYRRLESEIGLSERNVQTARDRVTLARRLFEGGRGDSFSVAEAEEELSEAENRWFDAEADLSVATYRLLRVLGTLLESPPDLKPREDP